LFRRAFISRGQHTTKEVEKAYSSIPENAFICHFSKQEVPDPNFAKPNLALSTILSHIFRQFKLIVLVQGLMEYLAGRRTMLAFKVSEDPFDEGIIDHVVLAR